MSDSPAETPAPAGARASIQPTLLELLSAFTQVSLAAFGGALPWSRRMIVERKRWMTNDEFNETFALSQFLPGPNTINFSVVFGSRFGGVAGAAVAFFGLIGPPLVIVTVLAALYERYGDIDTLGRILAGIASAASGLLIASVAKMAAPMFTKRWTRRRRSRSSPSSASPSCIGRCLTYSLAWRRWPLRSLGSGGEAKVRP